MNNFIIILFCASFAFLVGCFSTPKYSLSELDTNPIALKIDTFYYNYVSGGRIGPSGPTYVFESTNYKSIFIVPMDAYYSFDKDLFEKTVKKGDTINIIIRKNFKDIKRQRVNSFEISKGNIFFLKKEAALNAFSYARNVLFYTGLACSLIAFTILGIRKYRNSY